MITPDKSKEPAGAMRSGEQCVSLSALEMDGTAPAAGDEIEFTGKGRVSRVEGDKVYFETTEVNGEPVTSGAASEPETDDDDIMKVAEEADAAAG